jgi:organic radical activating enzyme
MEFRIVEIFSSIEGEGSLIGFPVLFIRLEGCNLRCPWCDTTYSYDGKSFKNYKLEQILDIVKKSRYKRVCLTGGEPLLTPNIDILASKILKLNKFLIIETNGTIFPQNLEQIIKNNRERIFIVVSPKPEVEYRINPNLIRYINEIKFVVDEFLKLEDILQYSDLYEKKSLVLQPEGNKEIFLEKALELQNILIEKFNIEAKVIPQCHKLLKLR